jgi:hypothetical protein
MTTEHHDALETRDPAVREAAPAGRAARPGAGRAGHAGHAEVLAASTPPP